MSQATHRVIATAAASPAAARPCAPAFSAATPTIRIVGGVAPPPPAAFVQD